MMLSIAPLACAFLLAPTHLANTRHTFVSANPASAISSAARPASRLQAPSAPSPLASRFQALRAPPPLAFDSGLLEELEIKQLLSRRGVVHAEDATRDELEALLEASSARATELDLPPPPLIDDAYPFTPAEERRVSVFEHVSPAVAYIQTSIDVKPPWQLRSSSIPAGAGSGFLFDSEGTIVTNFHVINGGPVRPGYAQGPPRKVKVRLPGCDEALEATVVGHEADKDLAVLKVDPAKLPANVQPLVPASSANLKVGQSVLAIGNPFGLDWTLTQGIVSAMGRDIDGAGGRPIKDCIQTDAAINPGNSGGPLLDSHGRLIGVNTMIYAPGGIGANVGIGFAVPVDTVQRVVNQILTLGQNARPSLGVSVLPDALRKQYAKNLNRPLEGALIADVVKGSPADEVDLKASVRQGAGVLLGDLITEVNGEAIATNEDLLCALEEAAPQTSLTLTVLRGCDPAKEEVVEVTPVPRNALGSE